MHYLTKFRTALLTAVLAVSAAGAATTLNWTDYDTNSVANREYLEKIFKQYHDQHPDVTLTRTVIPQGDFKSKLIQATATHSIPDLILLDNPDNQALAAQGTLADLTDKMKDWKYEYFKGPWSSTIYQGHNYGLPIQSNTLVVWYNLDLLKQAGIDKIPITWDEFRVAAKKLTNGSTYGLAFSAESNEVGTFTLLPLIWSAGADLQSFSSPASVKALTYLRDLVVVDKSASRSVVNWGPADLTNVWTSGRAAMMINGSWEIPNIRGAKLNFAWTIGPLPKDKEAISILGGENLALGNGNNVDEAWKFVLWLGEPSRLLGLIHARGQLPNRPDLVDEKSFDDIDKVFFESIRTAKARAYGPNYPKMSQILYTAFQKVVTGAGQPEQIANDTQKQLAPLLHAAGS
jgi:multiple sugar transport system substrate-binding protein